MGRPKYRGQEVPEGPRACRTHWKGTVGRLGLSGPANCLEPHCRAQGGWRSSAPLSGFPEQPSGSLGQRLSWLPCAQRRACPSPPAVAPSPTPPAPGPALTPPLQKGETPRTPATFRDCAHSLKRSDVLWLWVWPPGPLRTTSHPGPAGGHLARSASAPAWWPSAVTIQHPHIRGVPWPPHPPHPEC